MEVIKEYKRSIKFTCQKCGYPVLAKRGSECVVRGRCSPCIEGTRRVKMDWKRWKKGMRLKENRSTK